MTTKSISESLSCKTYTQSSSFSSDAIEHVIASDLMSEVLIAEEENMILITALNTEQTIRTANIVDAIAVLLVNGKKPQPGMIKLAEEFNLSLISTCLSMFDTCTAIHGLIQQK